LFFKTNGVADAADGKVFYVQGIEILVTGDVPSEV
jgi:hypothetical protein